MSNQILYNILISYSEILLLALSFSLIFTTTKIFHLAHASVISLGAYLTYYFTKQLSFPLSLSLIIAVAMAMIIGMLLEVIVYRPMRKNKYQSLVFLIASIGLYVIIQNCISLYFGDDTKIIDTGKITVGHSIFGAYITTLQIIIIGVSLGLFVSVNLFLHFSTTGKSIRAVASNPELCNIYGISSNKFIMIAFGIGSSLAATVGLFSGMDTNMTPMFGFNLLLYGIIAMIIGGVGSTGGLIAGALLVATAQHLAAYNIDAKWMDAATYIILIVFLIWRPQGFSGNRIRKVEV